MNRSPSILQKLIPDPTSEICYSAMPPEPVPVAHQQQTHDEFWGSACLCFCWFKRNCTGGEQKVTLREPVVKNLSVTTPQQSLLKNQRRSKTEVARKIAIIEDAITMLVKQIKSGAGNERKCATYATYCYGVRPTLLNKGISRKLGILLGLALRHGEGVGVDKDVTRAISYLQKAQQLAQTVVLDEYASDTLSHINMRLHMYQQPTDKVMQQRSDCPASYRIRTATF